LEKGSFQNEKADDDLEKKGGSNILAGQASSIRRRCGGGGEKREKGTGRKRGEIGWHGTVKKFLFAGQPESKTLRVDAGKWFDEPRKDPKSDKSATRIYQLCSPNRRRLQVSTNTKV